MTKKLLFLLALFGCLATAGAYAQLINYPTSEDGIYRVGVAYNTVKIHQNSYAVDCIKLENSYTASNYYIKLTTGGGFKQGDVITIAGAINNSDENKYATVHLFSTNGQTSTIIYDGFQNFINGRLVSGDPIEESYTLTADYDALYLGRYGNTAANVTLIKVTRSNSNLNLSQFEFIANDVYVCDQYYSNGRYPMSNTIECNSSEFGNSNLGLKLKISPDLDQLSGAYFTNITSSNPNVISVENGTEIRKYTENELSLGYLKIRGYGDATISVTFNCNGYNSKTISQEYHIVQPVQPQLSYSSSQTVTINENGTNHTYPSITLLTGGVSGYLELIATPAYIQDRVTYSWEPLYRSEYTNVMSDPSLITINESGLVTTANQVGRAKVTASYGGVSASYVVNVVTPSTSQPRFMYGDNIIFDYYDGCRYINRLLHAGTHGENHDANTVTYSGDNESVATVDGNTGYVTANKAGTVNVTAHIAETSSDYTYTLKLVENPFKYVVKSGLTPNVGDEVTSVPGIKMTYGGFSDNFGDGSSHSYNQPGKGTSLSDSYQAAKTDENGLQQYNYYFTTGKQDPRYESSDDDGNIRGWERIRVMTDYLNKTVPVYGTYYQFEPDRDGLLTVNVLQSGSIQDFSTSELDATNTAILNDIKENWPEIRDDRTTGDPRLIKTWNYKALYLTDERGITVEATSKASNSTYAHPYIYRIPESSTTHVDTDLPNNYRDRLSLKPHILGTKFDGTQMDGSKTEGYTYMFTYGATIDNDGNEIAAEGSPAKIKRQLAEAFGLSADEPSEQDYIDNLNIDHVIHIMENERHGYWTLTQSNSTYTFPVKAGKTYYLYTDGAKLGLNSFSFVANANAGSSTLTIDGNNDEANTTTLGAKNNCTVTLNRTLKPSQPNTLVLPFSVSAQKVKDVFGEGTQVLHVRSIDNCIHFVRHHHQMIVAGEPCVIYPTKAENSEWVFENVTVEDPAMFNDIQYVPVSGGGYTFTRCFEAVPMPVGSYYVSTQVGENPSSGGQDIYIYRLSSSGYKMTNTRAFFENTSSNPANVLSSTMVNDGVDEGEGSGTNGIRIIQTSETMPSAKVSGIYSISGQKMNGETFQKGIYIVNGRKMVIK